MFQDKLNGTNLFDIRTSIIKSVSNISGGLENLDLLPSSIDLVEIQDKLPYMMQMSNFTQNPMTVLASNLSQEIIDYYDYILVDCPPNLGTITLNGIYLSDYYLVPVIPDILSTYGITQIIDRVAKCADSIKEINRSYNIKPLGILISKYRSASRMHKQIASDLISRGICGELPKVFEYKIKETTRITEATDLSVSVNNLRQKFGYSSEVYDSLKKVTEEFISRVI